MKLKPKIIVSYLFSGLIVASSIQAQRGPQDSWYLDRVVDLPAMPQMNDPRDFDIAPNGDVYVPQTVMDNVVVWTTTGEYKLIFGQKGSGEGQFDNPVACFIFNDELFVTETGNDRVQVFDLNGSFRRKWGSNGSENGQLNNPRGIFVHQTDTGSPEVYIADANNYRIQVFDLNGTFLRKFGSQGTSLGQLYVPIGVVVDSDGMVYASSSNGNEIQVFDQNGTAVREIPLGMKGEAVALSGDRLVVTGGGSHRVKILDTNGTVLNIMGSGSSGSGTGNFDDPLGVAFAPDGNIHVSCEDNHRIQVFDSNGNYLQTYGRSGSGEVNLTALIPTPEGTFLAADPGSENILEFDENGSVLGFIATKGSNPGQVNNPSGVALGPNGRVYVPDRSNHRIQVFERNGTFVHAFGNSGTANGEFNEPWGIAVSNAGEVYVTDSYNHRIQVFSLEGNFLRKWGSKGNLEGQLNRPLGLILDDDGSVVVTDYDNNRAVVFDSNGTFLRKWNINSKAWTITNLNNGLILIGGGGNTDTTLKLYEKNGALVKNWNPGSGSASAVACLKDGTLVLAHRGTDQFLFYRPTYRTIRPEVSKDIPFPEVISMGQRAGTNYLDITFRVNDADSATVETALLGFIDGGNDLSKVVIPKTFVGSTANKIGPDVATGQNHTVTWNAAADWNVSFGEMEMAVLAKDDRELINLHFLTLPGSDSNETELKINRAPITENDLLNVWYWLLATGDTGIKLTGSLIHQPETPLASDFSPLSLPGIQLWLDANDIDGDSLGDTLEDNIGLSLWVDKAGGDHNATQTNESKKPSYALNSLNGKATVFFDNDGGMATTLNLTRPYTVVAVFNSIDTGSGARRAIQGSRNWLIGPYNGKIGFYADNWVSHSLTRQTGIFYLTMAINDGTTSSFIVDGMDRTTSSSHIGNPNTIHLGASGGYSGEKLNGYIAEVFAFDQALAESDRSNLGKYLAGKWNIGFSSASFVSNSSTTNLGRTYLFNKMNLREATTGEIARAKEGATEGVINAFTPTFKVGPDERPNKVNEYGFDTGSTTGFWVVPKE